jgi:hypothetical protein
VQEQKERQMKRFPILAFLVLVATGSAAQAHSGHPLSETLWHGFWHLVNTTEFLPIIAVLAIAGLWLVRRRFAQIS